MQIAEWMFELICELQPDRKAPDFAKWANTIRLMRERDGRTHDAIRHLFRLVQADEFWRTNVLSPDKLRSKWDDLRLKLDHVNGKSHDRRIALDLFDS
jgi:hypothetical protein